MYVPQQQSSWVLTEHCSHENLGFCPHSNLKLSVGILILAFHFKYFIPVCFRSDDIDMIIKGGSPLELVDLAPFPDLVDMPEKENENSETLFCFGESCGKEPGMLGRCTYSLSGQTPSLNLM